MIKGNNQAQVLKQFSEVSSLINKFGYRYSKGNFTFKIERDFIIFFIIFKVDRRDEVAVNEVVNTIRICQRILQ